MSNQNRIALFVDIDNMPLNKEHIDSIISQLEKSGEIVFAKFYGVTDRRHRDIICDAVSRGFETVPPVNPKKRGSIKVFDNRILVDICEMVFTGVSINSIAIVANPVNHVQLFAKLRLKNIAVYVCDNLDDDSLKFADKVLSFGYNDPNTALKLKRAKQKEKPKRVVRPIKKVEDIVEDAAPLHSAHEPVVKTVETVSDGKKDPIVIEVPITVNPVLDGKLPESNLDNRQLSAIRDELKVIQENTVKQVKEDDGVKENQQLAEIREELKALRSHISDVNKSGDNDAGIEQLYAIREELKSLHEHIGDVNKTDNKEDNAQLEAIRDELKSLHSYVERVNKPEDKGESEQLAAIREELRILHEQAERANQADAKIGERLSEIEKSVKDGKEVKQEASVIDELRVINEAQKAVNEMKNKPKVDNIDDPNNSGDDLDILRQIQQMKDEPSADDAEDAELIEKIKKLLDEFN